MAGPAAVLMRFEPGVYDAPARGVERDDTKTGVAVSEEAVKSRV